MDVWRCFFRYLHVIANFDLFCYAELWARAVGTPPQKGIRRYRGQFFSLPKGITMKRHLFSRNTRPSAFTLVEMLVVITIIGILASLITAAALRARIAARNATVSMEVKQLEMACQAYKEKLGDYPPDFAGVDGSMGPIVSTAQQQAILRHLARAFPRYRPGVSTNGSLAQPWNRFRADVLGRQPANLPGYEGWGVDVNMLTPMRALAFWLGGKPDWFLDASGSNRLQPGDAGYDGTRPLQGLLGFSADPTNPFDSSPSRIRPFFEFNPNRLRVDTNPAENMTYGFRYWPGSAMGDMSNGALVYFRAENQSYLLSGASKRVLEVGGATATIYAAVDDRLSTNTPSLQLTWINPSSFQIFSSGLDVLYATPDVNTFYGSPAVVGPYLFPSGNNYAPETYDDITNFSGGTLEDAIP